ncbi:Peroxidase [Trema orientale]|uniref:peroxidase n=1 Tax=Trema orientale TaxID=63057 RepID=A0A2P5DC73_TREOI|nr:Peroxidase [Trema orientale]
MCISGALMRIVALGLVLILSFAGQSYGNLQYGFYKGKCTILHKDDIVEKIVAQEVRKAYRKDNSIVAALLRLQFHDCFVNGCDASILLDGNNTEKTAFPNQSLRGYDLIDTIKKRLEKVCPEIVSCADIIAIATRDAISLATPLTRQGKPWKFSVQTGRMDGKISSASNTVDLPPPTIPVKDSIKLFQKKGLNATDMIHLVSKVGITVVEPHC